MAKLHAKQLAASGASNGYTLTYNSNTGLWEATAPGQTWTTVEDIDLSAEASQTLGTNGNYTIASKTFVKRNSAGDATAMAIGNGVGLRVQPAAATDYWYSVTAPLLGRNIQTAYPGVTAATGLRLWYRVASANITANYDGVFGYIMASYGVSKLRVRSGRQFVNANADAHAVLLSSEVSFRYPATGSYDVYVLEMPLGLAGGVSAAYGGTYASGWPTALTLIDAGDVQHTTDKFVVSEFEYGLGALRAASGTALVADISHVRLDVLA